MPRVRILLILLSYLFCCGGAIGETNLALHKPYALSPKPNHFVTTDEGDKRQLTDGKMFGSDWFKKSTVGWFYARTIPEVTIDLGEVEYIDELRVYSIASKVSDVEFPAFIAVLVSTDGKKYRFAGMVSRGGVSDAGRLHQRKVPHTFVIDSLNTGARFVKVAFRTKGHYLFIDEIEIIGRKQEPKRRRGFEALLQFGDLEELFRAVVDYLQENANVNETIKILRSNKGRFSDTFFDRVSTDLDAMAEKFKSPTNEIYLRNELASLGWKARSLRAQIYREVYRKPFVCFSANPMKVLLEKDMELVDVEELKRLDTQLWRQEYESTAINVSNCSDDVLWISASISPIIGPGGALFENEKTFTLRRAVYVKGRNTGSIADALVFQDGRGFDVRPGETIQLWITVFNPTLPPGNYESVIAIRAKQKNGEYLPVEELGVRMEVQPFVFPLETALNTCVWAYPQVSAATSRSAAEAMQDLMLHRVNVFVVHPGHIPFPGKRSGKSYSDILVDHSKSDQLIEMSGHIRTYLFFLFFSRKDGARSRFGVWMSPSWKIKFSSWLRNWVAHLRAMGLDYDRFALYPFDESLSNEFYEVAKLIKDIDPKIRIYANSFGKDPSDFMRFKDLIDIWCPRDRHCIEHPEWLWRIKGFGKEVWTYDSKGAGKSGHPYSYYRLMPWRAFQRGQTGAGFWVYVDYAWDRWDDYMTEPVGHYGVVYGAARSPVDTLGEKIIPSRRWEAWREGVEDYQYLYELQKAIDLKKMSDPQKANEVQEILDSQVNSVLDNPDDCEMVYGARRRIVDALMRVTGQRN